MWIHLLMHSPGTHTAVFSQSTQWHEWRWPPSPQAWGAHEGLTSEALGNCTWEGRMRGRLCVRNKETNTESKPHLICGMEENEETQYHILSVGGGGILMARVPESSRTSTLSIRGMLDTSAIFFLMYSFSVAFWKYLDFVILSTNLRIFLLVLPPVCLENIGKRA